MATTPSAGDITLLEPRCSSCWVYTSKVSSYGNMGAKHIEAKYTTLFLRSFSTVCMMSLGTSLVSYGLKHKGFAEKTIARWVDPENVELVLGLLIGFFMELTVAVGTGKLFTEPGQVLSRSLSEYPRRKTVNPYRAKT